MTTPALKLPAPLHAPIIPHAYSTTAFPVNNISLDLMYYPALDLFQLIARSAVRLGSMFQERSVCPVMGKSIMMAKIVARMTGISTTQQQQEPV